MRLKGKVAIITGAGSGLGKATALLFAQEGARVVVTDISQRRAEAVAEEINGRSRRKKAIAFRADVAKKEEVEAMAAAARKQFGPITILVNNAGIAQIKNFLAIAPEEWQRMLDVHMKGTFLCSQAVIADMIAASWGRIINTASVAGMEGGPQNAHYAAAKAAIIGFTRSLALEFARSGITVNAVAPGLIDNIVQATQGRAEGATVAGNISSTTAEQVMNYFLRRIPMRKLGTPEDIAYAHLYLASEEAGYITGQVLSPNGGYVL
ncbi:MAG TPA: SDR family NAD(P)-dependent oxidoreductase [Methylomirabilota bacterium]|jgi:2-hydroxycyclohexanecarboxyl-CoA dehydrogenase|nr:SDR family NAD(P)-dependent oxidoreductase [Methylomirabilota bacterium]